MGRPPSSETLAFAGVWKSNYETVRRALQLVRDRLEAHYQARNGVNLRTILILLCAREKDCTQTSIAAALDINPNVMVGIVDGMEKSGIIKRIRNLDNRREYILRPTAKGKELLQDVDHNFNSSAKSIWKPLTLREVGRIRALALKILAYACKVK